VPRRRRRRSSARRKLGWPTSSFASTPAGSTGFATRLAVGYVEAVPYLRRAVAAAAASPDVTALERWVVLVNNLAMELWDAGDASSLVGAMAADERERGALEHLRLTLLAIGLHAVWRGRFADADARTSPPKAAGHCPSSLRQPSGAARWRRPRRR
jgi:hypothetical protein